METLLDYVLGQIRYFDWWGFYYLNEYEVPKAYQNTPLSSLVKPLEDLHYRVELQNNGRKLSVRWESVKGATS